MALSLSSMNDLHDPAQVAEAPMAQVAAERHAFSTISSADLLRGQKAVAILHNGALYRLQETKAGKLILTK